MLKRVLCFGILLLTVTSASAQVIEIGGHAGYTLSEGIDFPATMVSGVTYDGVEQTDAFSWGFTVGARLRQGLGVGFLWDRQQSDLEVSGPRAKTNLGAMNVDNYHGVFSFDYPVPANPAVAGFLFLGLGATSFGNVNIMGQNVDGETRFSTTWGAGVKFNPGEGPVGFRAAIRWTPTYIKSDAGGVWCDPYWGCTSYSDPDYSHQVEFAGGLTYRFTMR